MQKVPQKQIRPSRDHAPGQAITPLRKTVCLIARFDPAIPRMMQVTVAAFQAKMSLYEQVTDPKSHTSVSTLILYRLLSCYLQNPMVDPMF